MRPWAGVWSVSPLLMLAPPLAMSAPVRLASPTFVTRPAPLFSSTIHGGPPPQLISPVVPSPLPARLITVAGFGSRLLVGAGVILLGLPRPLLASVVISRNLEAARMCRSVFRRSRPLLKIREGFSFFPRVVSW